MKLKYAVFAIAMLTLVGCSNLSKQSYSELDNTSKTALLYEKLIDGTSPNTAQLTLFFSKMPKGGDLHNHYSGSIYVETYLDWVKEAGYWIDSKTCTISKTYTDSCMSVDQLRSDTKTYRKLLTLWSDKDYQNHFHVQLPPDAAFFDTFRYFGPISNRYHKGLRILKERAIKENVSYIELMLSRVGYFYPDKFFDENSRKSTDEEYNTVLFDTLYSDINADDTFNTTVHTFIEKLEDVHKGIDDDLFMMRYQTYVLRSNQPSIVFSSMYAAFKVVAQSDLLVGVNIVGPENGVVALEDYTLHMQMFAYLKKKFPNVHRSLHAGELTLGMVRPKNLTFHISQALHIAEAQRIGHGVDLPYEQDALHLLQEIKEKSAIEICFTSNEFILGVKNNEHPYLIYSAYDVPMVVCTDDSGVSRNNLTNEYVLLAERYKPDYETIKKYVYNSITYAFIPEKDKRVLKNALDDRFVIFESEMSKYSGRLARD